MSPDIKNKLFNVVAAGAAAIAPNFPADFPDVDKAAREALGKAKEGENALVTQSLDERYGAFPAINSTPDNEHVGQGSDTRVDLQKQAETDNPSSIDVDPFTVGISILSIDPETLDLDDPVQRTNLLATPRVVDMVSSANNYISEIINQRAAANTVLNRDSFSIEFGIVPHEAGAAIGYVIVSEEEGLAYLINPVPDEDGKVSVSTISIGNPVSQVTVTGYIDERDGQLRMAPVFTVPGGKRYIPSMPDPYDGQTITVDDVSGVEFLETTPFSVEAADSYEDSVSTVEIRPTATPFHEGTSLIPDIPDVTFEDGKYYIFIDGQKQEVRMRNVVHIDGVDVPNPEFGVRPALNPEVLEPKYYITGLAVASDEVQLNIPNFVTPGETVTITVRRLYIKVPGINGGEDVTFRANNIVTDGLESYAVSPDGRSSTQIVGWQDFLRMNDPSNQGVFTVMQLPSANELMQSFIERDGICTEVCVQTVSYFDYFNRLTDEAMSMLEQDGEVMTNGDGVVDISRSGVTIAYPGRPA